MINKSNNLVSKAIRNSARGEECTLNIYGVCNYNPETTVLCHFPSEWDGKGLKSPDYCAGYGCSSCHSAIDGAHFYQFEPGEKEKYMRRSQNRTLAILIEKGILSVKGVK